MSIEFFCCVCLLVTKEANGADRKFLPIRPVSIKEKGKNPALAAALGLFQKDTEKAVDMDPKIRL